MSTLSNLSLTATNGIMNSAIGKLFDFVQSKVANGGRDVNCKFYYSYGAGGSILQVATKTVVGGVVGPLRDELHNAFNSLIDGKAKAKQQYNAQWVEDSINNVSREKQAYGSIPVDDVPNVVFALDEWGCICTDALMLMIQLDHTITIKQSWPSYGTVKYIDPSGREKEITPKNGRCEFPEFTCDKLVWYDTTAIINISSDKNMVVTRVQGRDYSRKELVSNGDIKFSVSGKITSGKPDVYPVKEIQKFYTVMQYKGIITVKNQVLAELGITRMVITDFSISQQEGYKSVQNYSFSAIGLQPAGEIEIVNDTLNITSMPSEGNNNEQDGEWEALMKEKLNGLKSMSKDLFSQGTALASGMLDNIL